MDKHSGWVLRFVVPTWDDSLRAAADAEALAAAEIFASEGVAVDLDVPHGPWAGGGVPEFISGHLSLLIHVGEAVGVWAGLRIGGRLFDTLSAAAWGRIVRAFKRVAATKVALPPDPMQGPVFQAQQIRLEVEQGIIWIGWYPDEADEALDALSGAVLPPLPAGPFLWSLIWAKLPGPVAENAWCLKLERSRNNVSRDGA
jgi:hypothetical protein